MPTKTCRHVKEDGAYCQCPALRGRGYCYFHLRTLGRQMKLASENARHRPHRLVLPPLEDMNAVQVALMQVLDALAGEVIDQRTAGLMLYGLQQAATNLRSATAAPALAVSDNQAAVAEEYPDFEAQFQLPLGLDLSTPPEVAFPPPDPKDDPQADPDAGKARPWVYRPKFDVFHVYPEDIELEELRLSGDMKAYDKRWRELDIREVKKTARVQYEKDHARHVIEAERRNDERRLSERTKVDEPWNRPETAPDRVFAPIPTTPAVGVELQSCPQPDAAGSMKKPPANTAAEEAMGERSQV